MVTWPWQRKRTAPRTLKVRSRGDFGDVNRVDFEELAPAIDTFLGQAAYLQLGYFETLSRGIRGTPELATKESLARAAGTALEAGDCITLTVARAVPDPFRQVPSLLGMSVAEARRRLAIVELLPTLTPSNLTEGTITAQDPLPGTLLHRNAHVRLVAK